LYANAARCAAASASFIFSITESIVWSVDRLLL
jgi:hypothetical protein